MNWYCFVNGPVIRQATWGVHLRRNLYEKVIGVPKLSLIMFKDPPPSWSSLLVQSLITFKHCLATTPWPNSCTFLVVVQRRSHNLQCTSRCDCECTGGAEIGT